MRIIRSPSVPVAQVRFFPRAHLKLAGPLAAVHVDPAIAARTEVIVAKASIDDVEHLFAAFEAFSEEGHEDLVLFLAGMEEGTDVPCVSQRATSEANRIYG
jgi:hypothetical protein